MDFSTLQSAPRQSYPAGYILIAEGQPLAGVYVLESGEVDIFKGEVLVAEIHDAGAVMGEMSWLLDTVPTATVKSRTPCTVRHIARPAEFFREHPEATVHMARLLARRVDSLNRYLVEIKNQFRDRADHLGMIDQILDSLMHKHPRDIPRRNVGH